MFDADWYLAITTFARETPWLHGVFVAITDYGVVLLALAVAAILWRERRGELRKAIWIPVAMVVGYLVNSGIKSWVVEARPCRALHDVVTVLPCDGPKDYSFPSNHTVVFAAFTGAVFLLNRAWGVLALVATLVMGFSRVYVGAHYPHDVLGGLVVGILIGLAGHFALALTKQRQATTT
ncbi:phosphatase PAP2 family protein [Amycolatopsis sp. CA-230715]|uniref:phosphatase PAP2 family protein n=1 Tax=Amycolatopsis sp. CA-230715 TaxID=2745196 RepID=UPI001C02E1A8|nr:phosphatase PAP2 family protein [Amycolatopsis sp. CA-230715]QWF80050.1 Undecaprenyl-diphosphatase BcrC [Amycolatopsis sp. CA-230715]